MEGFVSSAFCQNSALERHGCLDDGRDSTMLKRSDDFGGEKALGQAVLLS